MRYTMLMRFTALLVGAALAVHGQEKSLKEFLAEVAALPPGSDIADSPGLAMSLDRLCGETAGATSEALRSLDSALSHGGPVARGYVAQLLTGLSRRADAATVLGPHLLALLSLLYDADTRVQGLALMALPSPFLDRWDVVTPTLVRYVESANPNAKSQAGAVGVLLSYAPPDPRVWPAVERYAARQLGSADRAALLHNLALARDEVRDEAIVRMTIASLSDLSEPVRFEAVNALSRWGSRWGWGKVAAGVPALRLVEANPDEAESVRVAARRVLAAAAGHP